MGRYQERLDTEIERFIHAMISKSMEHNEQLANVPGIEADTYPGRDGAPRVADQDVGPTVDRVVKKLFKPWRTMPGPTDFDHHLERLATSAGELTSQKADLTLEEAKNFPLGGPEEIPNRMAEVDINVRQWRGETVDAFRRQYSDRFPLMVVAQANLYLVLKIVMEANQAIYREAWENIIDLTAAATHAMWGVEDAWGIDSDTNVAEGFTLLAAVAQIVGAATGPVGALVGAGVAGIATVVPSAINGDHSPNHLSAEHVDEVWNNLVNAMEKLRGNIADSEIVMERVLDDVYSALRDGYVELGTDGSNTDVLEPTMNILSPKPVGNLSDVRRPAPGYDPPER